MSNRRRTKGSLADILGSGEVAPGLRGNFDGTCIVCLRPMDTGLGFLGDVPWLIGGLIALGLPEDEADAVVMDAIRAIAEERPGAGPLWMRPDGSIELPVQVCCDCVRDCPAPFPDPVLAMRGAELPTIGQPPAA